LTIFLSNSAKSKFLGVLLGLVVLVFLEFMFALNYELCELVGVNYLKDYVLECLLLCRILFGFE